jgi:hypothetical protein
MSNLAAMQSGAPVATPAATPAAAAPPAPGSAAASSAPTPQDQRQALVVNDLQNQGLGHMVPAYLQQQQLAREDPDIQKQRDALIVREMYTQGLGSMVPQFQLQQSTAREAAIKAQQAQEDQDDQSITKDAYNRAGGDLNLTTQYAQAAGLSMKGLMNLQTYRANLATNLLTQKKLQDDLGKADFDQDQRNLATLRDRLDAFAKRPADDSEEGQAANWQNFLSSNAGLMSAEHMTQTLQKHPGPPTPQELTLYQLYHNLLTTASMSNADAARQSVITNAARGQRNDLISSLQGQTSPEDYQKVLDASSVPHDDIPTAAQMFDQDDKPIPSQFNMLNRMALTPEQKQAADNAKATLQASENYKLASLKLKQEQVDATNRRIDNANNNNKTAHQSMISQLADQAQALSAKGGGGSAQQALADVNNPNLYTDDSTDIGDYRGEVAKELQARINAPAEEAKRTYIPPAKATSQVGAMDRARYLAANPGKSMADATDQVVSQWKQGGAPKPAAATAPAPVATAPKTAAPAPPAVATKPFPRARLDAFAQANNMTSAQAEAALKAQNYIVQ